MEHMVSRPVETAFTGPAATVLGLSALGAIGNTHTVALDIGELQQIFPFGNRGKPLMTKNGVSIREYQVQCDPLQLPPSVSAVSR